MRERFALIFSTAMADVRNIEDGVQRLVQAPS